MSEFERIHEDLGYVTQALRRSQSPAPRSIYLLWAVVVAVGFALPDFAPRQVGTYWWVALPVGWGATAFLSTRHIRALGQRDARVGLRHLGHWGFMFLTLALVLLMAQRGGISWRAVGPLGLLIVALSYLQAGMHLDRKLLLPGLLMALGFGVLLYVEAYAWTIAGGLVAGGLVLSACMGSSGRALRSA